jgi:hypothetical protein
LLRPRTGALRLCRLSRFLLSNNPNFAFRLVTEFESTAAGTANQTYVGAGGTYGTAGTVRFDMVTVSGAVIPTATPPAPAWLSAPVLAGSQFQFTLNASSGSNYLLQASTNLGATNWSTLFQSNVLPFSTVPLAEPAAGLYTQRFYRVISLP